MRPLRLDVIRTESELAGTYEGNPFRVEFEKDNGYRFYFIPQSTGVMRITRPGRLVSEILSDQDKIMDSVGQHTHAEIKPLIVQILDWSKGWGGYHLEDRKGDEERLRRCYLEVVDQLHIRGGNSIVATAGHRAEGMRYSWSFRMIPKNTKQESLSDFELEVSCIDSVHDPMIRTMGVKTEGLLKPSIPLTHLEQAYIRWLEVAGEPIVSDLRWNDLLHAIRTEEIDMEMSKLYQIARSIANPMRTKREQLKRLLDSLKHSWILKCVRDHGTTEPLESITLEGYDVVVGECRLSLTKPKLNKKFLSSYDTAELKQDAEVPEDAPLLLKLYANYLKDKCEESWIKVLQELVLIDQKQK